MNSIRTNLRTMNYINLFKILLMLSIISSCKKEEAETQFDWIPTEHKYLFFDSSIVEWNTRAYFNVINDSSLFLYGSCPLNSSFFFKIQNNGKEVINLSSSINGSINDISFINNEIGYSLIYETQNTDHPGFYTTTDGGVSWNKRISDIRDFLDIHFSSQDSGIALSSNRKFIYCTTNGGVDWTKNKSISFTDSRFLYGLFSLTDDAKTCFLSCNDSLLYSNDGGFIWKLHSIPEIDIFSIYFLNVNVGYITNGKKIYKINQIGGKYKEVYEAENVISKIEAKNESEILFMLIGFHDLYSTTDGFITVNKSTVQAPNTDKYGDRIFVDFTLTSKGLLVDTKGTLYKPNKLE